MYGPSSPLAPEICGFDTGCYNWEKGTHRDPGSMEKVWCELLVVCGFRAAACPFGFLCRHSQCLEEASQGGSGHGPLAKPFFREQQSQTAVGGELAVPGVAVFPAKLKEKTQKNNQTKKSSALSPKKPN